MNNKKYINFYLTKDLANAFTRKADRSGVPKSHLLRKWIENYDSLDLQITVSKSSKLTQYSFAVDSDTHSQVNELARQYRIPVSLFLRLLIKKNLQIAYLTRLFDSKGDSMHEVSLKYSGLDRYILFELFDILPDFILALFSRRNKSWLRVGSSKIQIFEGKEAVVRAYQPALLINEVLFIEDLQAYDRCFPKALGSIWKDAVENNPQRFVEDIIVDFDNKKILEFYDGPRYVRKFLPKEISFGEFDFFCYGDKVNFVYLDEDYPVALSICSEPLVSKFKQLYKEVSCAIDSSLSLEE